MAYNLGGLDLGVIEDEHVRKASVSEVVGTPGTDSDSNEMIINSAPVRRISLSGVITGSVATLQTFLDTMEGFNTGNIPPEVESYVSDLHGTLVVFVDSFESDWKGGEPTILYYEIELVEVAAG